ncbi:MAG: Maf family protein, partial [Deltaproteobacteria bacterium]|nr:Maf family protein [Deltaproteobacteria bacterium]
DIKFRNLKPGEIERYLACGEYADKAGAYAIQGLGGFLIDRVRGSYTNIVGLPLAEVTEALDTLLAAP